MTEDRPMHRAADAALRDANGAHSIDYGSARGDASLATRRYRLLGSAVLDALSGLQLTRSGSR